MKFWEAIKAVTEGKIVTDTNNPNVNWMRIDKDHNGQEALLLSVQSGWGMYDSYSVTIEDFSEQACWKVIDTQPLNYSHETFTDKELVFRSFVKEEKKDARLTVCKNP